MQQIEKTTGTSQKLVQVGVIGAGFGQQVLIPALQSNTNCRVKAICASNQKNAEAVSDKLGIELAFGNWMEMVQRPEINAIAIAAPVHIQPEIAMAAIAHGKSVFLEKPVSVTVEQAYALLQAAEKANVAHMVDFEFPELSTWIQAKDLLDSGSIGKLRSANISWHMETYANRLGLDSWKTGSESGGALNLFCSHVFYHVEWFLGKIKTLSCKLARAPHDKRSADSIVMLSLITESNISVTVSISACAVLGNGHRLEFYGDDGAVVLENKKADYIKGFELWHGTRSTNELKLKAQEEHYLFIDLPAACTDGRIAAASKLTDRFIDWINKGVPSSPCLKEGYRVQELIQAARQSDSSSTWVECGSKL